MADYDDYDEYENEPQERKNPLADLRKQLKAAQKERDELKARNQELEGSTKKRTAEEVFAAQGVNAKAAKWFIAEGGDPSDRTAVDSWIKDNADLLGVEVQQAEPLSDDELDAADRQERITAPRNRGGNSIEKALQTVKGLNSREELDAWLTSQRGNPLQ